MANYSSAFSSGWATLILNITTESYSVANNSSYLKCVLQIRKDKRASSYNLSSASISMVVNGTTLYTSNSFDIRNLAVGSTQTLATNYITVSHNADGTKSVSCSASFTSGVKLGSASLSGVYVCDTIPRQATLTAAPDFNDEQNPTITYSNPAGNAVTALDACISFTGAIDDIGYRAISKTGTSYTFNLTEAERKTLRQWVTAGSTSRAVTFFVRTNIGGTYYHSTISKTLTIINDAPVLNSTVTITDNLTKDLTGNSDTIIKGVSTVNYAINAVAYKEAAINGQWVLNNGVYKYENTGTFDNLQSGYFLFAASDTRGRHIRKEVNKGFIDYVKLTCNADINVALSSEQLADITIKIFGNYFNNSFGAKDNHITLAYRYKIDDNAYGEWIYPTNPSFNGNTYELIVKLKDLDYRSSYTIQCAASDKISYIESTEHTVKAVPVFDWGKNDFCFNVPVNFKAGFNISTNLPAGNAKEKPYWLNIPSGIYFYSVNLHTIAEMPQSYGFVIVMHWGSDFSVLFLTQSAGAIYRLSGNTNVISDWVAI